MVRVLLARYLPRIYLELIVLRRVLNARPAYVDVAVPAEKFSTAFGTASKTAGRGGGFKAKTTVEGQVGRRDARMPSG